jgi:hypothetical protein
MTINDLPWELDQLVLTWQKKHLIDLVKEPIAVLDERHPAWKLLDRLATGKNLHTDLSSTTGGCDFTIHEPAKGIFLAWIQDTYVDHDEPQDQDEWIIVNSLHLQALLDWYDL